MTSLSDFVQIVVAMRSAQKDFFYNHSNQALERAKRLEARVDKLLVEMAERYVAQTAPLPGFTAESLVEEAK